MIAELKSTDGSDEQDAAKVCGYIAEQVPMQWLDSTSHFVSRVLNVE